MLGQQKSKKLTLSMLLTVVLIFTTISSGVTLAAQNQGEVLAGFLDPGYTDKPMVRMWFPDAGAGLDEYDTIEKQIQELAEAGFGGVEVTMLADGTELKNEEVKIVGWGTEAWRELLKKVLRAANKVEDGFAVDITITPHWPTIVNSIDPNDDAASQELSYSVTKITSEDLQKTAYDLKLPETKLYDGKNAPFIFTDTLVSAALMQVESKKPEDAEGEGAGVIFGFMGGEAGKTFDYVVDYDSMIVLEDITKSYGHAAGIPDKAALEKYYRESKLTYEDVIRLWGEEPAPDADLSASFNGKRDSEGNRARMADTQYYYQVDLSKYASQLSGYTASEGKDIQPGDWILVSVYRRGTGQVQSGPGSVLMYGRTYCTNYFDKSGVDAITHVWENNILDNELRALLKENGSCIFEDSIEASTSSSFWSYDLLDELGDSYQFKEEMPFVVALGESSFDRELAERIKEDYDQLLGNLYYTEHLEPIKDWASTFNYTYRAQAYGLDGVDPSFSATVVDISEGDNMTKGDGLRLLSGSVNMTDKNYLSMEAITGWDNLRVTWADIIAELNQNYSDGVNHAVLHGSPYNKGWNGYQSDWPGWQAFSMLFGPASDTPRFFAGTYHYRQIYWEDMGTLGNYMARIQAVLQRGVPKIDLAVISSSRSGNSLQTILDNGYSYNVFSEALTDMDNAVVSNGVLYEDGPGYKALIMDSVSKLSVDALRKLINFATDGLPIILLNTEPTAITGTNTAANNDTAMVELFAQLKESSNVYTADSEEEILSILADLSIIPDASYEQSQLEATHYVDESTGSDYYYLYNNTYPENSGMINTPSHAANFKSGKAIETVVTLKGDGIPYVLNAWTGEIIPIADYTVNGDGTISTKISLSGGESTIIGIINKNVDVTDVQDVHVVSKTGGEVLYQDGDIVFRSNEAGTYALVLSDGTTKSFTVEKTLNELDLSSATWDLKLQSFGPVESEDNIQDPIVSTSVLDTADKYMIYKDPSATKITTVNLEDIKLVSWSDLPVTQAQLDKLGVNSMSNVSGIGYYTTTFILPDGWTDTTGAILNLGYSQDQVTEVTVNGNTIENINNISDKVDIGKYLVAGENTITIKLCSTLYNRASAEYSLYKGLNTTYNETGLVSVSLSPYTQLNITR